MHLAVVECEYPAVIVDKRMSAGCYADFRASGQCIGWEIKYIAQILRPVNEFFQRLHPQSV